MLESWTLIYISHNTDMSVKLRFHMMMTSDWFYLQLLHLHFTFEFATFKEIAWQYLYFGILLYISQKDALSEISGYFGIMIMSYQFIINTFVLQFLICDFFKETTCKYHYFKILLCINQNIYMSGKWLHIYFWFFNSHFSTWIVTFL